MRCHRISFQLASRALVRYGFHERSVSTVGRLERGVRPGHHRTRIVDEAGSPSYYGHAVSRDDQIVRDGAVQIAAIARDTTDANSLMSG